MMKKLVLENLYKIVIPLFGAALPGLWKNHAQLVPFHSGQVENFYLRVLGQVQMY